MVDEKDKPCTVKGESTCTSCMLPDKIHCRWSHKVLNGFYAIGFPAFLGTLILLVMLNFITGQWWPIVLYILLVIIIFGYEIKFLCSHCPYYAGDEKSLKCLGNKGAPKIYQYNPGPMNGIEKNLMKMLIALFYGIIPVLGAIVTLFLVFTGPYDLISKTGAMGMVIMTLGECWSFLVIMKVFYCSMCINFSCPLNTVEKRIVDVPDEESCHA